MGEVATMQSELISSPVASSVTAGFSTAEGFALLQRMANMFAGSTLVPDQYKGSKNLGNCVIALNMAQRMNADPLMVMQNLYVVYGQPAWSAKFMIATFNMCGRYSSIHYDEIGTKGTDSWGCVAWAIEKKTGEKLVGPEVTIGTAKREGWYSKNGSKWQTMPEQMLRYRAASWFIRTTAPELSMGLQTTDEVIDVTPEPVEAARQEIRVNANAEVFEAADHTKPQRKNETPKNNNEKTESRNESAASENADDQTAAPANPAQQEMPEF